MSSKREIFVNNIKVLSKVVVIISAVLYVIFLLLIASSGMEIETIPIIFISVFAFLIPIGFMSFLLYGIGELIEIQCEQKEILTSISAGRQNNISNDELPKL